VSKFLVSYDLGTDVAREIVRERGTFVGESAYLVEFDGSAHELLLDLLGDMAIKKKVAVTDVIEKGHTLNVFALTGDWDGLGDGTTYSEAESVLGPRRS
jgi:hypothetical protein